jgi:uncharacterized cupin superfamily protein
MQQPRTRGSTNPGDLGEARADRGVPARLGREGLKTGIWEVTPGTFKSTRPGYDEICQILSGTATITEPDGSSFDIGPGSLFVTPAGWEGNWTIHETLPKMWGVIDLPA